MTLPEGVQPSGPTEAPVETAPEATASTEPAVEVPTVEVVPEETPEEIASDAALRAWAKDNGIEDVPASGRLSAAWREQITAAMAAALDPKDEASAETEDSSASSTSEMVTTEETTTDGESGEESTSAPTEPVQPEFDNPSGEYRSVFKAPAEWVHSQVYTA